MIKQTITYHDLDGRPFTEDFYFHLTLSELNQLNVNHATIRGLGENETLQVSGGYKEYIEAELGSGEGKRIMAVFRDMISRSYGVRSGDGKRFMKGEDQSLAKEFMETDAFDQLFMRLITEAEFGAAFFNGIMPANLTAEANKLTQEQLSQQARQRSESQMQGYQQPTPAAPQETLYENPTVNTLPAQPLQAPIVPTTPQYQQPQQFLQ
jgi:hypothetical protein